MKGSPVRNPVPIVRWPSRQFPYGYVQNRSIGLWCIGDQAAVIPSFSGDGIAIA
jgi:hypothetical protein